MYKVLIVEDEILVSTGLKNLIRWSDMGLVIVGEARDGKQGLELYHQKRPDIILTDIKMPVMDGVEMIRRIREKDSVTRIIVLSSYEDFDLVREAFVLCISDYILKLKMMPEEMENVMRRVCEEIRTDRGQAAKEMAAARQEDREEAARERAAEYILRRSCSYEEFRELAGYLRLREKGLVACCLEIFPLSQKQQRFGRQHMDKIAQIVLSLLQTLLSEQEWGEVFREEGKRYLLVLSFPDTGSSREREALCREILSRVQAAIRSCTNMKPVFGASSFADSYRELGRLYTEALDALGEAVLLEEEGVFYGRGSQEELEEKETVRREIAEALAYIRLHYSDQDLSLPRVAREVAIHKDYLSRLFKKETGVGFSDYINMLRIKKAQELLESTNMKSYEIARQVGFQDECYFSRVFKKIVGMGTNEYKKSRKDPVSG